MGAVGPSLPAFPEPSLPVGRPWRKRIVLFALFALVAVGVRLTVDALHAE